MKKQLILSSLLALTTAFANADTNNNTNSTKQSDTKVPISQVRDFSFYDMKGKTHKFSDYKGKWVLVNYWATYCPPCRAEVPDIEEFYRANKSKFVVLGMDAGGTSADSIDSFKKEFDITYPLIPAQESTQLAFGMIMGIPTSFIVSPSGEIVNTTVGLITYDDLDYHINPHNYQKNTSL